MSIDYERYRFPGRLRVAFATAFLKCAGTEHGQPAAFMVRLTVGLVKKDGAR